MRTRLADAAPTLRLADIGDAWTVVATQDTAAFRFDWMWRLDRAEVSAFHMAFDGGALLKAQRKAAGGLTELVAKRASGARRVRL